MNKKNIKLGIIIIAIVSVLYLIFMFTQNVPQFEVGQVYSDGELDIYDTVTGLFWTVLVLAVLFIINLFVEFKSKK